MAKMKGALVAGIVAAVAALTVLGGGPAQAGPDKGDEPARRAAADESRAPDRLAGGGKVVTPLAATKALAALQNRIAGWVADHGTAYSFGSYLDPRTGRIVLDTDAPADVVSSLTGLAGAGAAERQVAGQALVRRAATKDVFHRRDDSPPFYGGGGLYQGGGLCSSGFAVQNSAGTRFAVTAGHCYANGATVLTESGRYTYGTVSNRRLPTVTGHAQDMELIGGQSYAGRVFTGGVTSSSSVPVVSAGGAVVGFTNYCHSGRTTGEQCGHTATSTTAQVCTATGCKSPVIAYTGGTIQQGGDSGGSFYVKDASGAWIRGHVIASSSTTGYVTPWTVLAPAYGVSIVLG
ncbi:hypothetical protein [Phytohabitans houttuyneae]|uniref:Serine protease n=1 Tax=Phytohabitans houttuyneae TaxID=1076126 RepID=A0A6V8KLP5_9ACTN|nr:hypothetical protein [Phytohabitans houttuyneae]GFJ83331.1 serine protease [Phytohabitans houttuyneae]